MPIRPVEIKSKICPLVRKETGIQELIKVKHQKEFRWADEKGRIIFNNGGGVVAGKDIFPNGIFFHGDHPVFQDLNCQAIGEPRRPIRWILHDNNIKTPSPRLTVFPVDLEGARLSIMSVHSLFYDQERIDGEFAWPRFEVNLRTLPKNVMQRARSILATEPGRPWLIARQQPWLSVRLAEGFGEGIKGNYMIDYVELITGFLPVDEKRSVRVGQLVLYPTLPEDYSSNS